MPFLFCLCHITGYMVFLFKYDRMACFDSNMYSAASLRLAVFLLLCYDMLSKVRKLTKVMSFAT